MRESFDEGDTVIPRCDGGYASPRIYTVAALDRKDGTTLLVGVLGTYSADDFFAYPQHPRMKAA